MANSEYRGRDMLPEFQKFLLDKKLVTENKTTFFAYWVSRFLDYARSQEVTAVEYQESVVAAFLDGLRADARIQEWQPRQAEDALRLYYFHYLGKTKPETDTPAMGDASAVLAEMSRLIPILFT